MADAAEVAEPQPVTTEPRAGQSIIHDGKLYTTVKEGLAYILTPPGEPQLTDPNKRRNPEEDHSVQSVFYNPIQQFNRDLSVLAIRAFGEDVVEARSRKAAAKLAKSQRQTEKLKDRRWRKAQSATDAAVVNEPKAHNEQIAPENVRDEISYEASYDAEVIESTAPLPASKDPKVQSGLDVDDGVEAAIQNNNEDAIHSTKRKRESATQESVNEQISKKPCTDTARVAEELTSTIQACTATPHDDLEDQEINDSDLLALDSQKPLNGSPKAPNFSILDALSATGLRALRYAHEIPFVTSITANDLSSKATRMIQLNAQHNKLEAKISAITGNAIAHMYSFAGQESKGGPGHKYDVIDLDPYGTAALFLDAAVQAISDGGLLCVTCTDAGVFASSGYSEKTYSQYGGLPMKGPSSHEAGLRLILQSIATSAARYGMAIEPLLSLSIDFYARVFVCVRKSAAEVKFLSGKTMLVYNCDGGCGAWTTQMLGRNMKMEDKKGGTYWKHSVAQGPTAAAHCQHCGFKTHMAGPMYGGPIHNPAFIQRILSTLPSLDPSTYGTIDRVKGMLSNALEESTLTDAPLLPHPLTAKSNLQPPPTTDLQTSHANNTSFLPRVDPTATDNHPFFFKPDYLARVLHCPSPSEAAVKGALRHLGYRATRSHVKPGMVKTDAPWSVIWRVMREWVRQRAPIKEGRVKESMPAWKILQVKDEGLDGSEVMNGSVEEGAQKVNGSREHIKESLPEVVFDEALGKKDDQKGLLRYQLNPRANWGPMARAR